GYEIYYVNIILKPFLEKMKLAPGLFLDYCYYLKHFKKTQEINIGQLISCPDLLDACQKIRKGDGYSALGAVIIAPDVCIEDKRDFIRQLMMHGFELTQKDKALAALELYDEIPAEQKATMVCLLCVYKEGNLSILPYDIVQYVIQYIISLHKLW
ncbi:MAG TPA: hypothetical protein VJ201_01535, partial [Candidatus Babeliales bacterium]|nr:hypothetical protein [Candidatus Babeliales bacterium]